MENRRRWQAIAPLLVGVVLVGCATPAVSSHAAEDAVDASAFVAPEPGTLAPGCGSMTQFDYAEGSGGRSVDDAVAALSESLSRSLEEGTSKEWPWSAEDMTTTVQGASAQYTDPRLSDEKAGVIALDSFSSDGEFLGHLQVTRDAAGTWNVSGILVAHENGEPCPVIPAG